MSTCTTAPPAFRKLTSSARNDSSVCCASMSRSPAAMARRVSLSHSTKWRRDDESPLGRAIQRSGSRSCPGCTTNTSGYDFRKGQVFGYSLVADELQQPAIQSNSAPVKQHAHGELIALRNPPDQHFV